MAIKEKLDVSKLDSICSSIPLLTQNEKLLIDISYIPVCEIKSKTQVASDGHYPTNSVANENFWLPQPKILLLKWHKKL